MTHIFDLTGKRAVVTGGGTGIGLAMAQALADAGATVTLWGRRQEKLDEAAAANEKAGFLTQQVDVADPQQVTDGFAEAAKRMGGLDIVVANAGISAGPKKLAEVTPEEFRRVLAVNLDGAFFTIQQAANVMSEGGSIITVSSLASIDATPRNYAYGASKSGVIALTKAAAVELARKQIRVNAVLPGWIRTDMTEGSQNNEKFNNAVIPRVPARRWGNPEDFGGIAVYLASDAAAYQTGTSTVIDGGYSIF
ncbi:SDR family NAD(P)-dependent oxidoreductase [Cumulibacter manganitolerans]|uniref:SDR family NAD(P)-dependent oxidoreductase n=1 Tax=Cumulibacter manganitolerans TaxID=1884992 RepID=UPI0012976717|nr:SDR family oxidoreductase [Cumulibacter manganitolerans]